MFKVKLAFHIDKESHNPNRQSNTLVLEINIQLFTLESYTQIQPTAAVYSDEATNSLPDLKLQSLNWNALNLSSLNIARLSYLSRVPIDPRFY